jgi:polar amino acid transport system substrate-binding protein
LNGRYKIEDSLGKGGMSTVYKATDPNLKRVVAVKLIHPHLSDDPDFVRRFEIEAASVAQLRHPNIIQVYDFNHDEETYYMVLEFVPGESLQARLKRLNQQNRRLSVQSAVKYMVEISEAVDYAHKRGMIHRDIKPANVMLNVQDEAILMDFGIVKIVGGTQHTATGAVVGTALYMSPEQIRGEQADHRSDIYSLGVMLYEMVNGQPPFSADSAMTIMMMHLNDPLPDIRAMNPDVPAGMQEVIQKALEKDPAKRFQSADEMARALKNAFAAPEVPQASQEKTQVDSSDATVLEETPAPEMEPEKTAVESAPQPVQHASRPAASQTRAPSVSESQPKPAPATSQPAAGFLGGLPKNTVYIGGGIAAVLLLACIISGIAFLPRLLGGGTTATPAATEEIVSGVTTGEIENGNDGPELEPEPTNPPAPPTEEPVALLPDLQGREITIAVENAYLPFNFVSLETGEAQGWDYDFIREACSRLNCKPVWIEFAWDTMIASVAEGQFDMATDGITITESRAEAVDFSIGYMQIEQRMMVRVGEDRFSNAEEFAADPSLVLGEQVGTTNYETAVSLVGEERVITFDEFGLVVQALIAGDVDGVIIDETAGMGYTGVNAVYVELIGDSLASDELGFIFPKGSDLVEPFNEVIQAMQADGTLAEINSRWFGPNFTLTEADIDCGAYCGLFEGPYVEITEITLGSNGRYEVYYETHNYNPLISTDPAYQHIHFFYNVYAPETVGVAGVGDSVGGGSWILHDTPSPFTQFTTGNRPGGATQICALVANSDHSILLDTGNCVEIPE